MTRIQHGLTKVDGWRRCTMMTRRRPTIIPTLLLATFYLVVVAGSASFAQRPQIAADGDQEFARFVRTRWVLLDEENGLSGAIGTFDAATGRLNPTTAIRMELYNENAQLVSRVTTGAGGRFRVADLEGGLYQCIAQGSSGFLAFSLFAIERGEQTGRGNQPASTLLVQAPRQTEDRLDIFSAAVPPTFTQLNSILQLYYGRTPPAYLGQPGASAIANGDGGDLRDEFLPQDEQQESTATASAIRAYDVPLQDGNRIVGRLYTIDRDNGSPRSVREVYVHIIRDDQLVGPPIPVNEDGVFEAELFDGPGAYSIVAAGSGGFGACSFYARRVDEDNAAPAVSVTLASLRLAQQPPLEGAIRPLANAAQNAAPPYQLTMSLISDPRVLQQAIPAAAMVAIPDAGVALPDGGFGDTALAGGGGSSGGWAALLLGGGLAAGITAAAVNGDEQPISPSSPFASHVR